MQAPRSCFLNTKRCASRLKSSLEIMNPPTLFLFLSPFLALHLLGVTVLSQPKLLYSICTNDAGNYTSNSTYNANLHTLLTSLTSNKQIDYGFYNFSAGQGSDQVNAIALCRGDVLPDECRSCINDSAVQLTKVCPNQKQAVGWYDHCMLRYSNDSIFGIAETSPAVYNWDLGNASNVAEFNQVLLKLMANLRSKAASGDWRRKFATGEANLTSFGRMYGLMQCTPDLSQSSCDSCLDEATSNIQVCCAGKQGGRVIARSCNLRYETYRFYEFTAANAPPPAAAIPSSSPPPGVITPPASNTTPAKGNNNTARTVVLINVPAAVVSLMLIIAIWCFLIRSRVRRARRGVDAQDEDDSKIMESLQFDFATKRTATDNFADANKLGEGGFGPVYKGKLSNGQEIAVKRLSSGSRQGEAEFKNEVMLVAKLQHRNLVRLLGFCLEGTERLLVYEFVPKTSLDKFIFDPIKRTQLDWDKRYKIIEGIARGILYLHEDSRLRIIHRDIKASNILLDAEMNPKISDFGTARLFIVDQTRDNTSRIVGTYGYMAPEYAMHGHFSVKTSVYSFGALILEIVSGQQNTCFRNRENTEDLLSTAWKNWREGQATNLMDPTIRKGSTSEIMRCIHIGLLCVQENEADRPTMASIVLMLNSYSLSLPLPSQPAFFINSGTHGSLPLELNNSTSQSKTKSDHFRSKPAKFSANDVSISDMFPR